MIFVEPELYGSTGNQTALVTSTITNALLPRSSLYNQNRPRYIALKPQKQKHYTKLYRPSGFHTLLSLRFRFEFYHMKNNTSFLSFFSVTLLLLVFLSIR